MVDTLSWYFFESDNREAYYRYVKECVLISPSLWDTIKYGFINQMMKHALRMTQLSLFQNKPKFKEEEYKW